MNRCTRTKNIPPLPYIYMHLLQVYNIIYDQIIKMQAPSSNQLFTCSFWFGVLWEAAFRQKVPTLVNIFICFPYLFFRLSISSILIGSTLTHSCERLICFPYLFFRLSVSSILLSTTLTLLPACRVWPRSYFPDGILYPRSKHSHRYNLLFDGACLTSGILQLNAALLQSQNCDIRLVPNLKFSQESACGNLEQTPFVCLWAAVTSASWTWWNSYNNN